MTVEELKDLLKECDEDARIVVDPTLVRVGDYAEMVDVVPLPLMNAVKLIVM